MIITIFEVTILSDVNSFKYTGLLFLLLATSSIFAQQGAILKPLELDSTQMEINRQNDYRKLISGDFLNESENQKISLPGFNPNYVYRQGYNLNLDFMRLNHSPLIGFSTESLSSFYSPFFHDGVVLSEGAYSLGNKLIVGGFSYGANAIYTAPYHKQQLNDLDSYGSTLFMQYKVSKKFIIQTRVNVTGRPGPGY